MKILKLILIIGFTNFTWTSTFAQGLEIYLLKQNPLKSNESHSGGSCNYCFKPIKEDLLVSALIEQKDIEYFDWKNQIIKLKESGLKKIEDLYIPMQGLPVVLTINKEPIYGFWFWNDASSFGCDWICTYPKMGFQIDAGIPNKNLKGIDPRFDDRIKNYLTKINLIK